MARLRPLWRAYRRAVENALRGGVARHGDRGRPALNSRSAGRRRRTLALARRKIEGSGGGWWRAAKPAGRRGPLASLPRCAVFAWST